MNLNEEVRCDCTITKQTKEHWSVLLDLYKEFERVCKKNNLHFFAAEGTVIGAIRHKGFIPWDDDIDVGMMREDYEKLAKVAKDEFKEGYFYQCTYTDKIVRGHAQLRKDNTTCFLHNDFGKKFHRGIFLDIFVFDSIPDTKEEALRFYKSIEKRYKFLYMDWKRNPFEEGNPLIRFGKNLIKFLYANFMFCLYGGRKRAFKKFELACQVYNDKNTKHCGKVSFNSFNHKYYFLDKKDLEETFEVPFEDTTIIIPKGYDHFLKEMYGEYMVMVKASTAHGNLFVDTKKSYKNYQKISARQFKELFQ